MTSPVGSPVLRPRQIGRASVRASISAVQKDDLDGRGFDPAFARKLVQVLTTCQFLRSLPKMAARDLMGRRPLQAVSLGTRPATFTALERSSSLTGARALAPPWRASRSRFRGTHLPYTGLGSTLRAGNEVSNRGVPVAPRPLPERASSPGGEWAAGSVDNPSPKGKVAVHLQLLQIPRCGLPPPRSLRLRRFSRP